MPTDEQHPTPVVVNVQAPQAPPRPTKRTNHVLHALLTIVTGGTWGIVWVALILRRRGV